MNRLENSLENIDALIARELGLIKKINSVKLNLVDGIQVKYCLDPISYVEYKANLEEVETQINELTSFIRMQVIEKLSRMSVNKLNSIVIFLQSNGMYVNLNLFIEKIESNAFSDEEIRMITKAIKAHKE